MNSYAEISETADDNNVTLSNYSSKSEPDQLEKNLSNIGLIVDDHRKGRKKDLIKKKNCIRFNPKGSFTKK